MSFVVNPKLAGGPHEGKSFTDSVLARESAELAARDAEINQLVKREVAKLRAGAQAEGREAGLVLGRADGHAQAVAQLQNLIKAFENAANALVLPLARKENELSALVTEFSFELAGHIANAEITANRTGLRKLLAAMLRDAAAERQTTRMVNLRLHPDDLAALTALGALGEIAEIEHVTLLADEKISPGGALLEALPEGMPRSDFVIWDATMEGRVAAVRAALVKTVDDDA